MGYLHKINLHNDCLLAMRYPELEFEYYRTLRTDVLLSESRNPAPGSADIKAAAKPLNRDGDSIGMVYSPVRNPLWPAATWMAGSRVRWGVGTMGLSSPVSSGFGLMMVRGSVNICSNGMENTESSVALSPSEAFPYGSLLIAARGSRKI